MDHAHDIAAQADRSGHDPWRLFDLSRDLLAILSPRDGHRLAVNAAVVDALGWRREELTGEAALDLIHPDDRAQGCARVAGETGIVEKVPLRLRCRDGDYLATEWRIERTPDATIHGIGRVVAADEGATRDDAFLLRLSDALRKPESPTEVQAVAQRLLGEHLGAMRVCYAENLDGVRVQVTRDWTDGAQSLAGIFNYADYGADLAEALLVGRTLVRSDIAHDPALSPEECAAHEALGLAAMINVPLLKDGRFVALLAVHYAEPHVFDAAEIALIEATAERTWAAVERARAEAGLRESERKYRALFDSMDEGYCVIKLLYDGEDAVDWRFLEVNPAFEEHNGLVNAAGRTMRELNPAIEWKWIDIYAQVAESGVSLRFEEESQALGNRVFDLYASRVGPAEDRTVAVLFKDITMQRAAERELQVSENRLRVLVAELQHRVRNMLTVVRSVFSSTVSATDDLADVIQHFTGRLDALARTQTIITRTATGAVDLEELIRDELLSVGVQDGRHLRLHGPEVAVHGKVAETLGLALHELTTNALKYGALKHPAGRLGVTWRVDLDQSGDQRLHLSWVEEGVPVMSVGPSRDGFGRELIEHALPYRLGAETKLEFRGGGVRCSISVPLEADVEPFTGHGGPR